MIVGIMGFANAGKNSVAEILTLRGLERNEPFVEVAFADELKRLVMKLFDFTEEQCWGILKEVPDHRYPRVHYKEGVMECERNGEGEALCACCRLPVSRWRDNGCYLTSRYSQQVMGTEGARVCYSNIWADIGLRVAEKMAAGGYAYHRTTGAFWSPGLLPSNVVFADTRFINEFEAIKRAGGKVYRVKRVGYEEPPYNHPSETEQLQIPDDRLDGVINNDGDLNRLEHEVFRVMGWSQT